MTESDLQRVKDFMTRHAHIADDATDLAEMTACELELESELDDRDSPIWELAIDHTYQKWIPDED